MSNHLLHVLLINLEIIVLVHLRNSFETVANNISQEAVWIIVEALLVKDLHSEFVLDHGKIGVKKLLFKEFIVSLLGFNFLIHPFQSFLT